MQPKAKSSSSEFDRFIALLDRYAMLATRAGKKIHRTGGTEAREVFATLPADRGSWVCDRLGNEIAAIEQTIASGESLDNTSRLLWNYLQRTGFRSTSDIFDKIENEYVVEVYSTAQTHIWQSLNFFDWVTTPLERVYTETWVQNSVRDPEHEKKILHIAMDIFTGKTKETVKPDVPWHWIRETDTVAMHKFELLLRHMAPVTHDGQVIGLVTVNECRNLQITR